MNVLELECPTNEMAEMLGIHPRTLQALAKEGWIEGKIGHGRWNLARTVQSYAQHITFEQLSKRR